MTTSFFKAIAIVCLFMFGLSACAPLNQYRTDYTLCISQALSPTPQCETHAIQQLPASQETNYLLGFIEFDDQGVLWDRKQMRSVLDKLTTEAASKDLLIVVFVHGWKHSAAPGDKNIETFRQVLAGLSEAEAYQSRINKQPARQVAGVYLGWRGGSINVPWIENLTFWDRKNTAQKVGDGGVGEVLNRLELIKRDKDSIQAGSSNTRLVVVGHSFGGAVVNAAVSHILERGFINTVGPAGVQTDAAGFGNLVVLINPAFEALLHTQLSDMSTDRGSYFPSQLPILAQLTSEADWATRIAFPIGRWFSTLFEKQRELQRWNALTRTNEPINEGKASITAIGHFEPYRTHRLYRTDDKPREDFTKLSTEASARLFKESSATWANDKPGSKIPFEGLMLERTHNSAGRNPYLMVYVDKHLIRDHNDIDDPRVIEFIKQLILISSQNGAQAGQIHPLQKPADATP